MLKELECEEPAGAADNLTHPKYEVTVNGEEGKTALGSISGKRSGTASLPIKVLLTSG